jgi:membrane protease YdiL (CAAX protease family)
MPTTLLGVWGQLFMVQVLLVAPALGIVSYIRIRRGKPLPPKRDRYRRGIIFQFVFLLLIFLAAREEQVPMIAGPFPALTPWLLAAGFLVIFGLRLRQAWPKLTSERLVRARIILPDDPSLMRMWVVISAMAGITEECAYRGLAFRFLTDNGASVWPALLLCITTFAIAHMAQGWRGVLATGIVAALMHGVVYLTQSLYLAIVVHAVYDLMVGVIAMPILSNFAKTQTLAHPVEA